MASKKAPEVQPKKEEVQKKVSVEVSDMCRRHSNKRK